ncbi:MAG: BTAD domain-containing putative transcriptional regulator [Burkholderiaceae bacterium]
MRDPHHPASIKTTPPSLDGVIERERLTAALATLPVAAKWLQSPSGTGKSTLAASYAQTRAKTTVWYRLDERDNDPAFFYEKFSRAVRAESSATASLPAFSGDDHSRQQQFAHRFVAALSLQLAQHPTVIVLDDVQRVTAIEIQRALAALIEVASNGNEVLFVSESTASTAFFDAIASRQLALLNDADLRFSVEECRAMTAALRTDEKQIENIAALTGGHAGALVLACELLRGTDPKSVLGMATVERIHSHLLSKLVERMPPARRELLLRTAFVTQLSRPIAEALAGAAAAQELDALVEGGLLRRVGAGDTETFEAHGLVRQGMQSLAQAELGPADSRALAEATARALITDGQPEAAFALLVEIGSSSKALQVLGSLAEGYAVRGQTELLTSAIARLPLVEVQGNAWLCFWTGQALLRIDEEQARVWFSHAFSSFEAIGDSAGMRLAAACIVTAFGLECADLRDLDNWISRHASVGGETPIAEGERFETSLIMGVMCAAFVSAAYPPQIDADGLIARMNVLLGRNEVWLSDDQRVQAARILIEHGHVFARHQLARNMILATRALIDSAHAGALHRGRWLISAAYAYFESGDTERAKEYLDHARLVVEQSHSSRLAFELGLASADYSMKSQDLQSAVDELRTLETLATASAPAQRAEYARMLTRLLLLQGHAAEGLRWAEEAKRMALPAGFRGANLRGFEMEHVYALAANDRLADAVELISRQEFEPPEARLAVEYCLRFLLHGAENLESLSEGLGNARQIGFINLLDRARAPLARICSAALANGIEREFVLQLIAAKQLAPPPSTGPYWPWPVHVRTLGGLQVHVRGVRYKPSHKAQDKPLELLKLLVTCQALGRDSAEKVWIAERLWPDADMPNARKSLDMTIGRLRRLLSSEQAILTTEGRLQLSSACVWTDIQPLLAALSRARVHRDARVAGKQTDSGEASAYITAVLDHYQGPFLADEEGPPWLLAGREAIAAAVRYALVTADAMLRGDADQLLIPALERAVAADATSEDLARALMRAHLRQGHHSEALRVYRRLREMLSLVLNVAPSAESDAIRDQAYVAEGNRRTAAPSAVQ